MTQDEPLDHGEPLNMAKAVELLFSDSSKNVSDLKSRQWTATNLGVLAIIAIAVFAHDHATYRPMATALMILIVLCHVGVTRRCSTNLQTFRTRIKNLISWYFPKESHKLFEEKRKKKWWVHAKEGDVPKGKEGQQFENAVVDEGSIEFILYFTTPVTLIFALFVVWCSH